MEIVHFYSRKWHIEATHLNCLSNSIEFYLGENPEKCLLHLRKAVGASKNELFPCLKFIYLREYVNYAPHFFRSENTYNLKNDVFLYTLTPHIFLKKLWGVSVQNLSQVGCNLGPSWDSDPEISSISYFSERKSRPWFLIGEFLIGEGGVVS